MTVRSFVAWGALLLAALFAPAASAAITCTSIAAPDISINYLTNTSVAQQMFFTVTCNRSSTSDPTSLAYSVAVNNGQNNNGINNNAVLGGDKVRYDIYTSSCAGQKWQGGTSISDTISWAANQTGIATRNTTYWACINNPSSPGTSGDHTDSLTMTMTYNPGAGNLQLTGNISVHIYAPATCSIPAGSGPGNIALAYTSFSLTVVSGTTTFQTQCTVSMPYTLALNPASGTLAGVTYAVTLSNPTPNGTGAPQTFTITASAPAGQSGTCAGTSCLQSQVHTLTVSY
ncbi:MAG: spore coat protein U domain-containing protein [Ramlibacter sp.]|nr:spore coat protein U domain-containing protein [Ramlibacter sp.]